MSGENNVADEDIHELIAILKVEKHSADKEE